MTGIYPANGLVLEPTNANMWSFPTLDLRIATTLCWIRDDRTGLMILCVRSISKLYDKRREKCYDGIPIAQYTHVSSNVGQNVGRSILMGQLHRYRELIQDRDNFIYECGLLLARMHKNGYPVHVLKRKLLHFLRLHPDMFGAVHHRVLYDNIVSKWWVLSHPVMTGAHA